MSTAGKFKPRRLRRAPSFEDNNTHSNPFEAPQSPVNLEEYGIYSTTTTSGSSSLCSSDIRQFGRISSSSGEHNVAGSDTAERSSLSGSLQSGLSSQGHHSRHHRLSTTATSISTTSGSQVSSVVNRGGGANSASNNDGPWIPVSAEADGNSERSEHSRKKVPSLSTNEHSASLDGHNADGAHGTGIEDDTLDVNPNAELNDYLRGADNTGTAGSPRVVVAFTGNQSQSASSQRLVFSGNDDHSDSDSSVISTGTCATLVDTHIKFQESLPFCVSDTVNEYVRNAYQLLDHFDCIAGQVRSDRDRAELKRLYAVPFPICVFGTLRVHHNNNHYMGLPRGKLASAFDEQHITRDQFVQGLGDRRARYSGGGRYAFWAPATIHHISCKQLAVSCEKDSLCQAEIFFFSPTEFKTNIPGIDSLESFNPSNVRTSRYVRVLMWVHILPWSFFSELTTDLTQKRIWGAHLLQPGDLAHGPGLKNDPIGREDLAAQLDRVIRRPVNESVTRPPATPYVCVPAWVYSNATTNAWLTQLGAEESPVIWMPPAKKHSKT